ncbi:MAG: hypothetical protein WA102_05140 [Candidatus Methanoperedens sp.]
MLRLFTHSAPSLSRTTPTDAKFTGNADIDCIVATDKFRKSGEMDYIIGLYLIGQTRQYFSGCME